MPNPFPGMNPYWEDPITWAGTHNTLIAQFEAALNASLPPPYAAYAEARCYIERRDALITPDLAFGSPPQPPPFEGTRRTALLEPTRPSLEVQLYAEERREFYIEIRDVKHGQRVITTLELLSPANKNTRNRGHRLYRQKQQSVLASSTHLVEIDLLRAGKHTVAVPETALPSRAQYDYLCCVHLARSAGKFTIWLCTVRDSLPILSVPLEEGVPDVPLDLQSAVNRLYEEGGYARKIDYAEEAIPPLTGEDVAWADALLREKGLR